MKNRTDVLVMIWGMSGRDPQALIPTIYLLKEKYNLDVRVRSIFDYCSIELLKPRVLLTNGCNGSNETYRITKYATERGIYTVSLHGEGVFRKDNLTTSVIGRNRDGVPTVKKWFLWNTDAYTWTYAAFPQFRDVIDISGSPLHEKYSIFRSSDFNKEHHAGGRFSKVFTYIGWGFDDAERLYNNRAISHDPAPERQYATRLLMAAARQNPDVLFILKNHPGVLEKSRTEISDHFGNFDNVRVIDDEISIFELIFISDLIINYDSTTQLDSWLAGKPTITLYRGNVPLYPDDGYGYSDLREASVVPQDEECFLAYLREFKQKGGLSLTEEKRNLRDTCIRRYIGDPGSRPSEIVASHIVRSLNNDQRPIRSMDVRLFAKGLMNRFFYRVPDVPGPKRYLKMRIYYRPKVFAEQYRVFAPKLQRYFELPGR
jgi:surface carbohydrate biosynthesis protein